MLTSNSANSKSTRTFKKILDGKETRRSCEETTIQIRKNKKEERFRLKRFGAIGASKTTTDTVDTITIGTTNDNRSTIDKINKEIAESMDIFQRWYYTSTTTTTAAKVSDEELLFATKIIRRMLCVEKNSPVRQVLSAGVFGFLVEMINVDKFIDHPAILFEGAWALTNIASTEYTSYLVYDPHCINRLVLLLLNGAPDVREQAAWCIGNVAGDKIEYRDMLLHHTLYGKIIEGIDANLTSPDSPSLLANFSWAVSNLCRGKPEPDLALIRPFISFLHGAIRCSIQRVQAGLITISILKEMVADALWCLSYISDGNDDRIQALLDDTGNDIVKCINDIIKETLKSGETNHGGLLIPSIRCIGNIVSGSNEQATIVVASGILKMIPALLESASVRTRFFIYRVCCVWFLNPLGYIEDA